MTNSSPDPISLAPALLYPIGVTQLCGLCWYQGKFLSLDRIHGYVVAIDPQTDSTTVLNPLHTHLFRDANSLSHDGTHLWYTKGDRVYRCTLEDWSPELVSTLPDRGDGMGSLGKTIYVSCERRGVIFVVNSSNGQLITQFRTPGVGLESLTVADDCLWICDREEQTVFCLDRATGEERFSLLTPFENPTGIGLDLHNAQLWVLYSGDQRFIKDDPNSSEPYRLAVRDRSRLQPLHYRQCNVSTHRPFTLSNGYRVEMCYVEELAPLDPMILKNVEWRVALPSNSDRQRVISIEPFGLPYTEVEQDGQRVAVFHFEELTEQTRHIFGWRAVLDLYSIKYQVLPQDVRDEPLPEGFDRYLVDNEDLSMEQPTVLEAARESVRSETNPLRKMLCIRDYVYDRLSYRIRPHITPPHEVLQRGAGSCGEYVGVLLALSRLNGIPCRTIGRYKCPKEPEQFHLPLEPDYNHVWLEFYLPGVGWLPMESNPDDLGYGPYPLRFFMGLSWYHVEIGKGISFERVFVAGTPIKELPGELSIGNLAMNHVRFKILGEIAP